ncbi:MAG: hypothetical protein MUF61_00350 [archaeon]|nr:hypothetical protein [archaeon]
MGNLRIEGYTRADRIRHLGFHDDIPEVKDRMKEAGLRYASPNLLRGGTSIDNCVFDKTALVNITSDGSQRRCPVCLKEYYFVAESAPTRI